MRTLLVDNHDSYTFNVFQLIAAANGVDPVVISNDDPALTTLRPGAFDNIVISPGPGRPQVYRDLGYVGELLRRTTVPVLGVCLGHQAIAYAAGATVRSAPQPRHGHLTHVKHLGDDLFAGIPSEFIAVRYHSLCVEEPLPEDLEPIAWAEDGVLMALRHRQLPRWGVQFHPESVASEYGQKILANFRDLTVRFQLAVKNRPGGGTASVVKAVENRTASPPYRLVTAVLPDAVDTETVFLDSFRSSPTCFWLDSAVVATGLSRFSFLGDASGPLGEVLTYQVSAGAVTVRDSTGIRVEGGSMFDVLDRRLADRRIDDTDLPFDFTCGYVGYFGYEMKADCGSTGRHFAPTPDAAWIFADRLIAVDHQQGRTYVLAVHNGDEQVRSAAAEWVRRTAERLAGMSSRPDADPDADPDAVQDTVAAVVPDPEAFLVRGRGRYLADVEECQRQLAHGESYEICVTNMMRVPYDGDETAFYLRLRRVNPAPYAAFLRVAGIAICSSSPERFLRIEPDRTIQSKPIKGTAPRSTDPVRDAALAASLAASDKTRAENLMIVDLLRNDLGQVCEVGSVEVTRYMTVESYATVHQLVSTIQGRLRSTVSPVDCVRHCFPGGSMTGAPKERTMEIIDRLETEARGVYSGSIGYFGLTGGADLNIVIRTAVLLGDELSIGAGGAIVLDSDPREEFDEMLLKAMAPLRAWRPAPALSTGRAR